MWILSLMPLNKALAKAIIDTGKKKKTIARLCRMSAGELSNIIHGSRPANPVYRSRLAKVLNRSEDELFAEPDVADASSEARAS